MRVLRTEMYFDPADIRWDSPDGRRENPGVTVAWFGGETRDVDLRELDFFIRAGSQLSYLDIAGFLEDALQETRKGVEGIYPFGRAELLDGTAVGQRDMRNTGTVDYIMRQTVVIERSPPTGEELMALLKSASFITAGAFVGYESAMTGSYLLMATVPAGIIVVGAAVAVSKAMDKGLNKAVKRLFDKKKKR